MDASRVEFLLAASVVLLEPRLLGAQTPWYQSMRRCGQINFNERDPEVLNIQEWLDYWSTLKLDALLLNAGGIMAVYPTRIPYHHKNAYLGAHDPFCAFTQGTKARGSRVVARFQCTNPFPEAHAPPPEW